jgi:hypothetical protein
VEPGADLVDGDAVAFADVVEREPLPGGQDGGRAGRHVRVCDDGDPADLELLGHVVDSPHA